MALTLPPDFIATTRSAAPSMPSSTGRAHEACPDCGEIPKGAWQYGRQWFVKCPQNGCHNCTAPSDSPDGAWRTWDAWARRARLNKARLEYDRELDEASLW